MDQSTLPQKTVLPVKGQTAKMPEFDSAAIILKWKNTPGTEIDMDAMVFGISDSGEPVAIFSNLYRDQDKTIDRQGALDKFPYIRLHEDDLGGGEWGEERIDMTALVGHKELHIVLYNYTMTQTKEDDWPKLPTFKALEARVQLILSHEGEVVKNFDIPVAEDKHGIAVAISQIDVTSEGNKIKNETRVVSEAEFYQIPGTSEFKKK